VIRRLQDPVAKKSSIGIVTFSNVQKDYIERKLTAAIAEKRLEDVAYDREEPIFRQKISKTYRAMSGTSFSFPSVTVPTDRGRISLNFGPLNQAGGWRRLNVARRARGRRWSFSRP